MNTDKDDRDDRDEENDKPGSEPPGILQYYRETETNENFSPPQPARAPPGVTVMVANSTRLSR